MLASVTDADSGSPETRPRDHRIGKNDIQDNRVGIELLRTDTTIIEENIYLGNHIQVDRILIGHGIFRTGIAS